VASRPVDAYERLLLKRDLLPEQWKCLSSVARSAVVTLASGPAIETPAGLHKIKALTHWNWDQVQRWLIKCVTVDVEVRRAEEAQSSDVGPPSDPATAATALTQGQYKF
jgi:hypothetical protein